MSNIFCRSPYIIEINEVGQTASKVELFLWNGNGAAPGSPQYTLTNNIPASNNEQTLYNISPYIQEFIDLEQAPTNFNTIPLASTDNWCNVIVKRYKLDGSYTLLDTTQYKAFNGYTEFTQGANHDRGDIHLDEATYYYWRVAGNNVSSYPFQRGGQIQVITGTGYYVTYSPIGGGATQTYALTNDRVVLIPRVETTTLNMYDTGNKVEIFDGVSTLLWTGYFKPKTECKYAPLTLDYVNKYGAWSRTWFYKAKNETIQQQQKTFKTLPSALPNYSVSRGQTKQYDVMLNESIKVNTDWVDEAYNDELVQIMASEHLLLDGLPVRLKTQSTELFTHLNQKLINYSLEFEYNYDKINNVI